jgi:hypothetical protein
MREGRNEPATYRKTNNTQDLHGYQHRTNLLKDEKGDLLAVSHNILSRWKNYFWQLWNVGVRGVDGARFSEMYASGPVVLKPVF